MKSRTQPSAALIVSIVALVVASAGTAGAAKLLITSSSQVKTGAINGFDIANESIKGADVRDGSITSRDISPATAETFSKGATQSASPSVTAQEAFRKAGPEGQRPFQQSRVLTLRLEPGSYAISAKVILTSLTGDQGVLAELLRDDKTASGHCVLVTANGDVDESRDAIATALSASPATVNLQTLRTLDQPTDVQVNCDSNAPWRASDSSIVAIKLGSVKRDAVSG